VKVFVTGGNGFIGSVVVRELVRCGHSVVCLLRPTSRTHRIEGLPFERRPGDVRDAAAVRAGMEGCDATIHLAGVSSWNEINSPALTAVVEGGTGNVLEAAAELGNHRVVFVSSTTAVNGSDDPQIFDETAEFTLRDPALRYAHAKHHAEQLCLRAWRMGVPVIIVNPAETYGPCDDSMVTAGNLLDFARSSPVMVCRGGTSVAHVEDVACGIVAALSRGRPGERYILGGENVTIEQLAAHSLQLLGRRARIVKVPNTFLRAVTRAAARVRLPLPYNQHVIPYATRYWFMNHAKAERELGVRFRDARETLMPTIAWLKEAGHVA
jgi:dihydroflavonol-4-reductase